ncbi:MAG TPA: hypothetical protein VLT62_10970 [Candidatus Methylomirabilis sp.]|nr:hypothetical protein [Candidatus Methylomirabilis sp.]
MNQITDLSRLYDEIVAAAARQGLLTFPGYVGDELPAVWWQGDPNDWGEFLRIAKVEGMRTVFVGRAILEQEDLQDLAEWVDERTGPGPSNGDRARLKEFERYIGSTGEVRLGWVKDGVAFLLQQRTEWYDEFLELTDEIEGDDDLEDFDHPG